MTEHVYNKIIKMDSHKHWEYIEQSWYKLILNNRDSIKINLDISTEDPLDVIEIRFNNICNKISDGSIGKMYAYVDKRPALPTIGVQSDDIPVYMSTPRCPKYGTMKVDVWSTEDIVKPGQTEFLYVYKGYVPLSVKTIELYIVKKSLGDWRHVCVADFHTYASCSKSKEKPIVDTEKNSVTLPVASDNPDCCKNYMDAVGKTTCILYEFKFKGIFRGGSNAPSASEEMAIFAGKNKVTWDEEEFGFVFTNNDKVLKGYAQGKVGENKFYKYVVLDTSPDGLEHTYRASVRKNTPNIIDYYIDSVLKGSITTDVSVNYYNLPYYIIGTTHRNVCGWDSDDYKLTIKDIRCR